MAIMTARELIPDPNRARATLSERKTLTPNPIPLDSTNQI